MTIWGRLILLAIGLAIVLPITSYEEDKVLPAQYAQMSKCNQGRPDDNVIIECMRDAGYRLDSYKTSCVFGTPKFTRRSTYVMCYSKETDIAK